MDPLHELFASGNKCTKNNLIVKTFFPVLWAMATLHYT